MQKAVKAKRGNETIGRATERAGRHDAERFDNAAARPSLYQRERFVKEEGTP